MRVLVLGGYGFMGSGASYLIAKHTDAEVVIAGRRLEKAKEQATKINNKLSIDRASYQFIDIDEQKSLVDAIKEADVVINCIGPFYAHATKVYKAAIQAGTNCTDICDDARAVESALNLNDKAKDAGVTIITGLGSSPGLSNILVKHSASLLDPPNDVTIAWVDSIIDFGGAAVFKHTILGLAGPVHQFVDGKLVEVQGFSGREVFEFPPPIGKAEILNCDHPEPLTIPLYVKGVRSVIVKGGVIPLSLQNMFGDWAHVGLISENLIKIGESRIAPLDFLVAFIDEVLIPRERKSDRIPNIGGLRIEVSGKENGEETKHIYNMVGTMTGGTAVPLSIGTAMLLRKDIKIKGVVPPEGCIDPGPFLKELEKRSRVSLKEIAKLYDLVPKG